MGAQGQLVDRVGQAERRTDDVDQPGQDRQDGHCGSGRPRPDESANGHTDASQRQRIQPEDQ